MRIVHLSDVHVQIDYRQLPLRRYGWRRAVAQLEWMGLGRAKRFEGAREVLGQIVAEIVELRPDHVVLSGDLTAMAVEEEFAGAREALAPIARPGLLSVIPGNHDRYTARAVNERRFERHFADLQSGDLPGLRAATGYPFVKLVGDSLAVIGLDTSRLAPLPGLSFGSVGAEQLGLLARVIDEPVVRDRALCVLIHHAPLRKNAKPDGICHGLHDGARLLSLLAGRRCTIHHGHVHHRYWHPATPNRPHVFNAGSATQRGREGYWVIDIASDGQVSAEKRVPKNADRGRPPGRA